MAFVNFSDWLNANQDNSMRKRLEDKNRQLGESAIAARESAAAMGLANADRQGTTNFDTGADYYKAAQEASQKAEAFTNSAKTAGGRQELLRQEYGSGVSPWDSLLVGGNEAGKALHTNAATGDKNNFSQWLQNTQNAMQTRASEFQVREAENARKKAARDAAIAAERQAKEAAAAKAKADEQKKFDDTKQTILRQLQSQQSGATGSAFPILQAYQKLTGKNVMLGFGATQYSKQDIANMTNEVADILTRKLTGRG